MKLRLLTSLAGDGFSYDCHTEVEFPEADAARLLAAGYAVRVEPTQEIPAPAGTDQYVIVQQVAPVEPKRRKRG